MTAALPDRPDRPRRPADRAWVKGVGDASPSPGIASTGPAATGESVTGETGAARDAVTGVAEPTVAEPGLAEQLACVRAVRELLAGIDGHGADATDPLRIDLLTATEELKGAITAAQARVTVAFAESQQAAGQAAGRGAREVDRGIGPQLALARRCSASTADRHRSLAASLTTVLPHTLAALTAGTVGEGHAQAMHTATTGLSAEVRMVIDSRLAGRLPILTPKQLGAAATHLAAELDVEALVARHRLAVTNRGAWTRPAPDGMAYLTVLGPLPEIVGAVAALHAHATAVTAGRAPDDPAEDRTHAQVMADTALTRLSGRSVGQAQPVAVTLVMTPDNLYGHHTSPYPADHDTGDTKTGTSADTDGNVGAGGVGSGRRLRLVRDPSAQDGTSDGSPNKDAQAPHAIPAGDTDRDGPEGTDTAARPGTAADSGTADDSGTANDSGTAAEPGTADDSGTGAESGTPDESGTANDSGTAAEPGTANDSGTGAESGTPDESGTANDSGTAAEPGTANDSGTAAEPGTANDSGTGAESGTRDDSGTAADSGTADGPGTGNDSGAADSDAADDSATAADTDTDTAREADADKSHRPGTRARCAPTATPVRIVGHGPIAAPLARAWLLHGCDTPDNDDVVGNDEYPDHPPPDHTEARHPEPPSSAHDRPADRGREAPPGTTVPPHHDPLPGQHDEASDRGRDASPGHTDPPHPGPTPTRLDGASGRGAEPGPGQQTGGSAPSISTAAPHPAEVWLRRAFTSADGRELIALESTARLFPPQLRALLVLRDDKCRMPFCDAPIRHADHITPVVAGGPTTLTNGQGLSARCNYTKDLAGFSTRTLTDTELTDFAAGPDNDGNTQIARQAGPDTHVTAVTTPTGHTYLSSNPPALGWAGHT